MTKSQLFIFIFLIVFTNQDLLENFKSCSEADKNQCKSVQLSDKNQECCLIYSDSGLNTTEINYMCLNNYKMDPEQMEHYKKRMEELHGFTRTMNNDPSKAYTHTYDCPSQQYSVLYNYWGFTDEEKEIFKKDNFCLRLFYEGLYELNMLPNVNLEQKTITKEDCSNAAMLPSSKEIENCGFASLDYLLSDGSTKHFTTCIYISKYSFNTKKLDPYLQYMFSSWNKIDGKDVSSFKIDISDADGRSLKYDSRTQTLTSDSSSSSNNKGELIGISKLLTLIVMIYLL